MLEEVKRKIALEHSIRAKRKECEREEKEVLKVMSAVFIILIAFFCVIPSCFAAAINREDLNKSIYYTAAQVSLRKGDELFRAPKPNIQEGPSVNNPWNPKFRKERYFAHHVWFEDCTCWLNVAMAAAKELDGRDVVVYYTNTTSFRIHFRNPREATAALNILLQGENIELPPYWVEKEVA